jgi:hypothetical protein
MDKFFNVKVSHMKLCDIMIKCQLCSKLIGEHKILGKIGPKRRKRPNMTAATLQQKAIRDGVSLRQGYLNIM